jgi:hypothetical protein
VLNFPNQCHFHIPNNWVVFCRTLRTQLWCTQSPMAQPSRKLRRFSWALALSAACVLSFHAAAQESRVSPGSPPTANNAASASSAPSPASSSNSLSQACQQRLKQVEFQSNIPVMMIQIAAAPATAAELQLLAKGPRLPGLMTTCGGPGGAELASLTSASQRI